MISREYYIDNNYRVIIDNILEPIKMTLVRIIGDNLERYNLPKGFVDVSDEAIFSDEAIASGKVISNNTIMEGTDGVGKSVSIDALLKKGILCQDRSIEYVSKYMFFDIPMEVRAKAIEDYLLAGDKCIIFLVNNSQEDLEERINKREVISEYDLEAFQYNGLYVSTYEYMQANDMLHDKLFLVDCTHKSLEEQIDLIFNTILQYNSRDNVKSRTLKL